MRKEKRRFNWSIVRLAVTMMLFGSCLGGAAYAATLKVPGTHPTITAALEAAAAGDTITVAAGTYQENIILKSGVTLEGGWNKDFSSRDIAANETILDGSKEAGPTVQGADNATLDGFTVINATRKVLANGDTMGSGVYLKNTSPTISNNKIIGNEPAGIYCNASSAVILNNVIAKSKEAGLFMEKASNLKIHGNVVDGNTFAGISAGDKPENKPDSQVDIRNNLIKENGRAGIDMASAKGQVYNNIIDSNKDAAIRIVIGPVEFVNNTVVGNARTAVMILDPKLVPMIKNNIIVNNGEAGIRSPAGGYSNNLLFSNNSAGTCDSHYLWCVKLNFGGYEDEESHIKDKNVIADPLFVDPANHDYHLQAASPAIDAGDPDAKYNDVNFPPSLGWDINDMGAYGGPFAIKEEKKGENREPVAVIHQDIDGEAVYKADRIRLTADKSLDPDGDSISYKWRLMSAPEGSTASIKKSNSNDIKISVKADKAGDYEFGLMVKDRYDKTSKPTMFKVTVLDNKPPKANVGEALANVKVGDTVTLYGSASKDPDGDPVTYKWEIVFKPEKSNATLVDATKVNPTFQVDALGTYAVQLIVNDGSVDSAPELAYVSTGHKAVGGKRHVPGEYPTIQSAIDAADAGDEIVVQKGTYQENIVVDKNVSLTGVDWPVITGGAMKGNTNTLMFAYLGDSAGKLEGFIITGGGQGGLGHGINIWDSSPEIKGNKIHGNWHNGIGIHGRGTLTSKTKIHNNEIYDNGLGLGNGLGSNAHVYDNDIHDNKVVGIGCRGLAKPWVDGNRIHDNRLGIGTREVSSPRIENNHIYNNYDGVVISPVSTIKKFAGEDIYINNNLLFNNKRSGITITNFNMNKIFVLNNTVDSNNLLEFPDRAGGLVFGWPEPGEFTAVVENNIVTNNKVNGIANFTGSELISAPGATILNKDNVIWGNARDYEGVKPGAGEISQDPKFISKDGVTHGQYFLDPSSPAKGRGFQYPN
ncbi:MAG: right-handed parallel beta-helix repeat-containing protein [Desulfobulbaceae bacterium]|nr:right-handed parallel beta-helix repeat-containing protein [Desulfobulbaceae bacterium]